MAYSNDWFPDISVCHLPACLEGKDVIACKMVASSKTTMHGS